MRLSLIRCLHGRGTAQRDTTIFLCMFFYIPFFFISLLFCLLLFRPLFFFTAPSPPPYSYSPSRSTSPSPSPPLSPAPLSPPFPYPLPLSLFLLLPSPPPTPSPSPAFPRLLPLSEPPRQRRSLAPGTRFKKLRDCRDKLKIIEDVLALCLEVRPSINTVSCPSPSLNIPRSGSLVRALALSRVVWRALLSCWVDGWPW